MDISTGLEGMRDWLARADWSGLISEFDERLRQIDPQAATRIASIPTSSFESEVAAGLARAADSIDWSTKAVYWEFDADNGWASAFFLCRDYRAEGDADDDWAADFDEGRIIRGPSFGSLAGEYQSGWDQTESMIARNLALIARTLAAIGRAAEAWSAEVPLCAGFHDQEVVFRIRDTAAIT